MYYEGEDEAYGSFDNLGNGIYTGAGRKGWVGTETGSETEGPTGKGIPVTSGFGKGARTGYGAVSRKVEIPGPIYNIPFSGNIDEMQARAFGQVRSRLAREKRGPWAPRAGMNVATGQALTGSVRSRFTEGPAKRMRQEHETDIGPKPRGLRGIWNAITRGRGRKVGLKRLIAQQRIEDDMVTMPGGQLRWGMPKLYRKQKDYEFGEEIERGPGVAIRQPFGGRGLFGWLRRLFRGRTMRPVDSGVKPLGSVDNLYGWEFEPGSKSFTRWPSEPETFTTEYEGSYSNL